MYYHRVMESDNKSPRVNNYWAGIVIHHISLPYIAAMDEVMLMNKDEELQYTLEVCKFLCSETSKVSAHFVISRGGEIIRLVDPSTHQAWHAGCSRWYNWKTRQFRDHCNQFMLGIELIGDGMKFNFTKEQYYSLDLVCRHLMEEYNIKPISAIVGHDLIALPDGRKKDPGVYFDWDFFYSLLYQNSGYFKTISR